MIEGLAISGEAFEAVSGIRAVAEGLVTDLPLDEIERLEALGGAEINVAKAILANEVIKLAHGEDAALKATEAAQAAFSGSEALDAAYRRSVWSALQLNGA